MNHEQGSGRAPMGAEPGTARQALLGGAAKPERPAQGLPHDVKQRGGFRESRPNHCFQALLLHCKQVRWGAAV